MLPALLFVLASCDWNKVYTVSFESNGAGEVEALKVKYGAKAHEVEVSREGYEFLGWYTDSEFSEEYSFSKPVKSNITLYAKWNLITKPVQFSSLGLDIVNAAMLDEVNYTIRFDYETESGNDYVYYKFDGKGSTLKADIGIAESNMDPDGITWMCNLRQYMLIDSKYYYIDCDADTLGDGSKNYQSIYFYAKYFQSELTDSKYWSFHDKDGNYYKNSDDRFIYKNKNGNTLSINDDTITLDIADGTAFDKEWLNQTVRYASIKKIYKVTITSVGKTKIDKSADDFSDAIRAF